VRFTSSSSSLLDEVFASISFREADSASLAASHITVYVEARDAANQFLLISVSTVSPFAGAAKGFLLQFHRPLFWQSIVLIQWYPFDSDFQILDCTTNEIYNSVESQIRGTVESETANELMTC
jgi:hypothetical protein